MFGIINTCIAGMTPGQRRAVSWIAAGTAVGVFILTVLSGTVCTQADIFTSVGNKFQDIYTKIGFVISALALIAIAVCAFKWLLGTDPTAVRTARTWLFNIVIGLAVYWLAYVIINTVQDIASTDTDTSLNVTGQ